MTRTTAELNELLATQLGHLERSLAAFNSGIWAEAERLANTSYILLADGRSRTKPLLGQLDIRDKIRFVSMRNRAVVYVGVPLCTVENVDGSHRYMPLFASDYERAKKINWLNFQDWWEEPVYTDGLGSKLSRKLVVKTLRDQDGGAHLDATVTEPSYAEMKSLGFNRIQIVNGKPGITVFASECVVTDEMREQMKGPPFRNPPIPGAHWATMAHIAWEISQSLSRPEAQNELALRLGQS